MINNNFNAIKYVGYVDDNPMSTHFFSDETVEYIYKQISKVLKEKHKEKRTVLVPKDNIIQVMNHIFSTTKQINEDDKHVTKLKQNTVDYCVDVIHNELHIPSNNFDIQSSFYGVDNKYGLNRYSGDIRNNTNKNMRNAFAVTGSVIFD
jgi:signal transduction histidine kinase